MRPVTDLQLAGALAALVLGTWAGVDRVGWVATVGLVFWAAALSVRHRRAQWWCLVVGLLLVIGAVRSTAAWVDATSPRLGPYRGWATVVSDPVDVGRGTRVVAEVEGQRFDVWAFGRLRSGIGRLSAGEQVWLSGERLPSTNGRRAATRHVVGRFAVETVADRRDGTPLATAANRVRSRILFAAQRSMPSVEASLFGGLVLGDDRQQPDWLVDAFRRAGMSHLTAVSGQNVAYVVAGCAPLLSRLRPRLRWAATCSVVVWFMAVTRFEPSVLRAGVMAIISATAFATGRTASPVRLVVLACGALIAADPLLVWSVSLWLSAGATAGVILGGPWCAARLPGPRWLRETLGTSLGAQAGVALPSLLVFGRMPVIAPVANLLTVPVAGFVMLLGMPIGLVAPSLPEPLPAAVMAPLWWGTWWVEVVALRAAAVGPTGSASIMCWVAAVTIWAWWWRRRACAVPI